MQQRKERYRETGPCQPPGQNAVPSAIVEVALTSTAVPTWQKWYSHEASASVMKTS